MSDKRVAIIGSGPSGLTAAIYTSRASLDTTVYSGMQPGGQLTTTTEIENFPGFPEGLMGPELMMNMQKQAERFGAKVDMKEVKKITKDGDKFTIADNYGESAEYDAVIVASGASARYLGLPGEDEWIGKGYHSCATCDGFFYRDKTIAIVGGGDSAMEESNFLTKFATKVYLINRSESFRASKIMLKRAQDNPKIEIVTNAKISQFLGEPGAMAGLELEDTVTGDERNLDDVQGVFVAIGHIPNSQFVNGEEDTLDLDRNETGYLIPQLRRPPEDRTSKYDTMSNIEGIFVAGDVEDHIYRQAITAAGDGCKAAMDCEKWLEE